MNQKIFGTPLVVWYIAFPRTKIDAIKLVLSNRIMPFCKLRCTVLRADSERKKYIIFVHQANVPNQFLEKQVQAALESLSNLMRMHIVYVM